MFSLYRILADSTYIDKSVITSPFEYNMIRDKYSHLLIKTYGGNKYVKLSIS